MNRRDFLKMTAASAMAMSMPSLLKANTTYQGKFLVTVYAHGGWDPTSYCDPKMNIGGERIINNWANNLDTQSAGNINYAPFANNDAFFKAHHKKMLVINGINVKTNSHEAGERFNLTGTMDNGYPTLSALLAKSEKNQELMPWLHNGFRPYSGSLLAPSRIGSNNDINRLKILANPNLYKSGSTSTYLKDEDIAIINRYRAEKALRQQTNNMQLLRQRQQFRNYYDATFDAPGFQQFFNLYDTADIKGLSRSNGFYRQALYAMSGFKSGLSISADLRVHNFDTHGNHDVNHASRLTSLNNTVDLLWHLADQFGIADRLIVHIASDIGRTNRYNDKGGKDHWSVTSGVIMTNDSNVGNRVIGSSDDGHFAHKLNLNTLQRDDNGSYLEPKHVMSSLRQYLGLENHTEALQTDLSVNQTPGIFNPGKSIT